MSGKETMAADQTSTLDAEALRELRWRTERARNSPTAPLPFLTVAQADAVLAALEEREELRRQVRVAMETLADFAAIDRERMAQQERVQQLEAALRQIASCEPSAPGDVVHPARDASAAGAAESREAEQAGDPSSAPRVPNPEMARVPYREGGRCDGLG